MNQEKFNGNTYCLTPGNKEQVSSFVSLEPCYGNDVEDTTAQEYEADSIGRLQNKRTNGCLKVNKDKRIKTTICCPIDDNDLLDSRLFYLTMDSALASFHTEGVGYITLNVRNYADPAWPGLRMKEYRNFTDTSQKWIISES